MSWQQFILKYTQTTLCGRVALRKFLTAVERIISFHVHVLEFRYDTKVI